MARGRGIAGVEHPAGLAIGDQGGILGRIGGAGGDRRPRMAAMVVSARASGPAACDQGEASDKNYEQRSRESAKPGARLFTHYSPIVLFPAPQIRIDKTKSRLRSQRELRIKAAHL